MKYYAVVKKELVESLWTDLEWFPGNIIELKKKVQKSIYSAYIVCYILCKKRK